MDHVGKPDLAAVPLPQIRREMLKPAVRAGTSVNPVAVPGDWVDWRKQAEVEYVALSAALRMLERPGETSTALPGAAGCDVLRDLGVTLASVRERAGWLAGIAEAAARQIGAILAARPDGNTAAMEVCAALLPGNPESTADEQIIQAAADAECLERMQMDFEEAADTHDDDSAEAAACRVAADQAGKNSAQKLQEVVSTPASCRAAEAAKARLLLNWLGMAPGGNLPESAYPADRLAFSLASDVLRAAAAQA